MGARDSENDLSKVFPDLNTIQREADPSRRRAKLEQALDNPEIDAALSRLRRGLKEGEDPLYYEVPRREATPVPPGPSPWADGAGGQVSKESLPSALVPGVAPPVTVAPPVHDEPRRRREISPAAALGAILTVLLPLGLMWFFFVRPHGPAIDRDSVPTALPSALAIASHATSMIAPTVQSAPPAASVTVDAPGSSALPDAGAAPASSAAPSAKPPGRKQPPVKQGAPASTAAPAPTDEAPEMFQ